MCTTGTNGLRGCNTSETPVAKNGFPATSAGVGGRMPSRASRSLAICADLSVAADPGFAAQAGHRWRSIMPEGAPCGYRLCLADRRRDFRREVLRLLREAFAQRVAREAPHLDVLADHRDGRVHLVLNAALSVRVLEE